jgi:hypothetical protein
MYVLALTDWLSVSLEMVTFLVTAIGLAFVVVSLRQTGEQQRLEAGPYVRVDLGTYDLDMPDFARPDVFFHNHDECVELVSEYEESVTVVAWFRNYQPHPLGMAFGLTAVFSIDTEEISMVNAVSIPYLEHGKAVAIDIARCSAIAWTELRLIELSFLDFYDRPYEHSHGEHGTNSLHGRLSAFLDSDGLVAVPEGRARGTGIDIGSD